MQINSVRGYDHNNAPVFGYRLEKPEKGKPDLWREHFEQQERSIYLQTQNVKNEMEEGTDRDIEVRKYDEFINSLQYLSDKKYDIYPIAAKYKTQVKELNDGLALAEYDAFLNSISKKQKNPHALDIVISQPYATYNYADNGMNKSYIAIKLGSSKSKYHYLYEQHGTFAPSPYDKPKVSFYEFAGVDGPRKLADIVDKAVDDMFKTKVEEIRSNSSLRASQRKKEELDRERAAVQKRADELYNKGSHKSFKDVISNLFN